MQTRTKQGLIVRHGAAAIVLTLAGGLPALGQFTSDNAELQSQIPLNGFASSPANGNDCWGYVSPSQREYALMGLANIVAVVEVTDPSNPVIISEIPHSNSLWCDVKTYQTYAYAVNESGGGIDVINLGGVDLGSVSFSTTTNGGVNTSHNIAINEDTGYAYLCGSNLSGGRLAAYSLANPASPALVGSVSSLEGAYCHDAQIVLYTTLPYVGREIAFCANGGTGLDIYDVTDKGNMFRMSRTTYPNLNYCHQCWLSDDRTYLYVNDETDGVNETVIFNVSDLNNPVLVGTYNSGVAATDHNLYLHEGLIYEAEYHAGVRVFDAADPENPVQVAWFDTYPENDGAGFDGAWSVYPYFPSGNIIVSDIDRGMFTVRIGAADILFDYPTGRPDQLDPAGDSFPVNIVEQAPGSLVGGSALLHYDIGNGFVSTPLVPPAAGGTDNIYTAVFPASECGSQIAYYFSADTTGGQTVRDPAGAPNTTYHALSAVGLTQVFNDDFETDLGWSVANGVGLTDGAWDRGVPIGGGDRGDPPNDADGSGQCYLTDNVDGNSDVDGGSTTLTSPTMDASQGDTLLSYFRWYDNSAGSAPGEDVFVVEISDTDGLTWVPLETVGPGGAEVSGGWILKQFDLTQIGGFTPNNLFRIRFTATDVLNGSVVEAGVDGVNLSILDCGGVIPGDVNGDGVVDILDLLQLLGDWGACPPPCPSDIDGSGTVDILDLLDLLANWS